MKTFSEYAKQSPASQPPAAVTEDWHKPKVGVKRDSVITKIARHERAAVKANSKGDANRRRYHLEKIRELRSKHSVSEESRNYQFESLHEMIDDLRRANADLTETHATVSEMHDLLTVNETTLSPKPQSVDKIKSLLSIGVVSKKIESALHRVVAKLDSGSSSFSSEERAALSTLLDTLIGLVTGDDAVYKKT